jgi:16S rRNA processing protein RimM
MGRVMGPYGVRGWVKVAPFTSTTAALAEYPEWWLVPREGLEGRAWPVESARIHADTVVAKLAGIDTREAAAVLKGLLVAVPRDALPPLGDDEMYVGDLVGMTVVNRRGETLGKVEAVDSFGAHPVMRVAADGGAVRLVPFVAALVDAVDREAGRVEVDWGLDY